MHGASNPEKIAEGASMLERELKATLQMRQLSQPGAEVWTWAGDESKASDGPGEFVKLIAGKGP